MAQSRRLLLKCGVGIVLGLFVIGFLEQEALLGPKNSIIRLKSARGVNYSNLQQLLAQGKWKEADRQTTDRMLQAMGKDSWSDIKLADRVGWGKTRLNPKSYLLLLII